ncbi:MAG: ABC transporter permease subunit [Marinilabiliales bacterium]|nr:ABC transporter permease subunit [Marinilabiliales bacterium]
MRKLEEKIMKVLMLLSSAIILFVLGFILWKIVQMGLPSLNWDMVSKTPAGGFYLGKEGGILNAILGSLMLIGCSVFISIFLSLPVALYINFILQRKSRASGIIRFAFDVMFGIPSIVYGAFGFMVMMYLGMQASLLGGIIAVSLLIIPIMVRSIDEVAAQVPKDLLEAPLSLGATRYEMVKIAARQISPGITTAILLAIGRGIGDAATVMLTAGFTDGIPTSLMQPVATLPLAIFFQLSSPMEEVQQRAYSAALILTLLILILSFSTRYFSRKFSKTRI